MNSKDLKVGDIFYHPDATQYAAVYVAESPKKAICIYSGRHPHEVGTIFEISSDHEVSLVDIDIFDGDTCIGRTWNQKEQKLVDKQ